MSELTDGLAEVDGHVGHHCRDLKLARGYYEKSCSEHKYGKFGGHLLHNATVRFETSVKVKSKE